MKTATDRPFVGMTELRNSFHSSSYYSRKSIDELQAILDTQPERRTAAQRSLVRKIANHLCGIEGCTCGRNEFNER